MHHREWNTGFLRLWPGRQAMCESRGWTPGCMSRNGPSTCSGIPSTGHRPTAAPAGAARPSFRAQLRDTITFCSRATASPSEIISAWRLTATPTRTLCGAKAGTTIRPDRSGTLADDNPSYRPPSSGFLLHHHSTDQISDAGNVMLRAPLFHAIDNLLCGARVPVAGGTDLDGGRSGEHE